MKARTDSEIERIVREAFDAGDFQGAATQAIRGYGPRLLGYLVALSRDVESAREIFAQACEDLWRGLPKFRWESSLRTWAFTLCYHASCREAETAWRRRVRRLATSEASRLAAEVASSSTSHRRALAKRLREGLEPDDQTLLILRVHHELPWKDVSSVLGVDGATLRKRFERIKARLRLNAAKLDAMESARSG
jgi:RNA polymerase sigma-70 factor (ECF subfamily)